MIAMIEYILLAKIVNTDSEKKFDKISLVVMIQISVEI
jgi:hypothetical protein